MDKVPFLKIAFGTPMAQLQSELAAHPELFGEHNYRKNIAGGPHGEMDDIWVRYNDLANLDCNNPAKFNEEHYPVWYPSYYQIPAVKKILFDLMTYVQGEHLGAVLITKLPIGGKILPHVDGSWHAGFYDKFYIPVVNKTGSVFAFENGVIAPDEGDVYWFDNSKLHWVENNSNSERIALIVCIKTDMFKDLK
jgi:hypothetical protein